MPDIDLKVQGNGFHQGYTDLTGADSMYEAVDDSDSTTHDSDTTKFTLPRYVQSTGAGIVSFRMFDMAEHVIPSQVVLRVGAKRGGAAHPRLHIGFNKGGVTAFSASLFDPGASYSVVTRTFTTNPLTSAAWADGDLVNLEPCFQNEDGVSGSNDLTLVSGQVAYPAGIMNRHISDYGEPLTP